MKFKVGDKVKVLRYDGTAPWAKSKISSIGMVDNRLLGYCGVYFERDSQCLYYSDYELELVQDKPKTYNGAEAIALAVAGKCLEPVNGSFAKPFYIFYDKKQNKLMNYNISRANKEWTYTYIFKCQWKVISPKPQEPKFTIGSYVITNEHDIGKVMKSYPHLTNVTYDVSFNGRTAVNYNEELLTLA